VGGLMGIYFANQQYFLQENIVMISCQWVYKTRNRAGILEFLNNLWE